MINKYNDQSLPLYEYSYTYLIGWTAHDKFYYGVRYAKNCHPDDLWKTYFTSSTHVKHFVIMHGPPNVIVVRKIFNDKNTAITWENTVLRRLDVIHSHRWLNKTDNRAILYTRSQKHIEEFKLRVEQARAAGKLFGRGSKHTDASNQLNRKKHLGKATGRTSDSFTPEWKRNLSVANLGRVRPQTDTEKEKRREAAKTSSFNKVCAGRIWITNGIQSIRIYPEQLVNYPEYIRGRIKRHT